MAKRAIKLDFLSVAPTELNSVLRRFYGEVKSIKGKPLTPSALTGFRAATHRHVISPEINRSFNIMTDREFIPANQKPTSRKGIQSQNISLQYVQVICRSCLHILHSGEETRMVSWNVSGSVCVSTSVAGGGKVGPPCLTFLVNFSRKHKWIQAGIRDNRDDRNNQTSSIG